MVEPLSLKPLEEMAQPYPEDGVTCGMELAESRDANGGGAWVTPLSLGAVD